MARNKKARLTSNEDGDKLWFINEERQELNDLILRCSTVNNNGNVNFTRIEVEIAFLKCHSRKFLRFLSDIPIKVENDDLPEIGMEEAPLTVVSFLNILYSMPEEQIAPFDHWVLVIEMGLKYESNIVVDRGIWYLYDVFRLVSAGKANFSVKYDKATAFQLLIILNKVIQSSLNIYKFPIQEIHDVFYECWQAYCKRCGIGFSSSKPDCACGGCKGPCCHHNLQASLKLNQFLTQEIAQHFSSKDVFLFQQVLDDYMAGEEKILSKIYLSYLS